jgi:hypothetical protein
MNHTAAAIREAADRGGYGYRWWKVDDIEDGVGYNALPMRALTEHLYDRAFWEALGKARGWQDTGAWLFHWHRFIDHIAFGKDVESPVANAGQPAPTLFEPRPPNRKGSVTLSCEMQNAMASMR